MAQMLHQAVRFCRKLFQWVELNCTESFGKGGVVPFPSPPTAPPEKNTHTMRINNKYE